MTRCFFKTGQNNKKAKKKRRKNESWEQWTDDLISLEEKHCPFILWFGFQILAFQGCKVTVHQQHDLSQGKHKSDRVIEVCVPAPLIDPVVPERGSQEQTVDKHISHQEAIAKVYQVNKGKVVSLTGMSVKLKTKRFLTLESGLEKRKKP